MKKFFLVMLFAVFYSATNAAQFSCADEPQGRSIVINKGATSKPRTRDLFPDVQATLRQSQRAIELQMFEIGVAQVYIVDSFGRVVYEDTVDGDNNFAFVEAPQSKGVYTLVIWSPYFYGEGTFVIGQ